MQDAKRFSKSRRSSFVSFAKGALVLGCFASGCSLESGDMNGADAEVTSSSFALDTLHSVNVMRTMGVVVGSIRALDSQNALPSGAIPALRSQLVQLSLVSLRSREASPILASLWRTLDGQKLVAYLARCALGEGDPGLLGLPGRLGLARDWQSRPLNETGQRWVTACLMAHTNNLASIDIAVSGATGALMAPTAPPRGDGAWRIEEAAFYGNAFGANPKLHACAGVDTALRCNDSGVSEALKRRICGTAGAAACGFSFAGDCNALAAAAGDACIPALPYARCAATANNRGAPVTAFAFAEVITVSLRTDADLLRLNPACAQGVPDCNHTVCTMGSALALRCSAGVCAGDSYCCTGAWDSECVARARALGACGP